MLSIEHFSSICNYGTKRKISENTKDLCAKHYRKPGVNRKAKIAKHRGQLSVIGNHTRNIEFVGKTSQN